MRTLRLLAQHMALGLAASVLAGCADLPRREPIARWHIANNEEIAVSERQMIVRNVLRARDQESMVFTRVSEVSGNSNRGVAGTLGLTFRQNEDDTISPSLGMTQSSNPSWSIDVLNSQEFTQGILRPIDLEILGYYVSQGWPSELFGYLFVESVLITEEAASQEICRRAAPCLIQNDPDSNTGEQFALFERWLAEIGRATICPRDHEAFAAISTPSLQQALDAFDRGDVELRSAGDALQLHASPAHDICVFAGGGPHATGYYAIAGNGAPEGAHTEQGLSNSAPRGTIHLRSLAGALYYLGEGLRDDGPNRDLQSEPGFIVRNYRRPWSSDVPAGCIAETPRSGGETMWSCPYYLFRVRSAASRYGDVVINHHGQSYYVAFLDRAPNSAAPNDRYGDRSQMVIALMLQLLGLYQSSDDRPATGTVRVIN